MGTGTVGLKSWWRPISCPTEGSRSLGDVQLPQQTKKFIAYFMKASSFSIMLKTALELQLPNQIVLPGNKTFKMLFSWVATLDANPRLPLQGIWNGAATSLAYEPIKRRGHPQVSVADTRIPSSSWDAKITSTECSGWIIISTAIRNRRITKVLKNGQLPAEAKMRTNYLI